MLLIRAGFVVALAAALLAGCASAPSATPAGPAVQGRAPGPAPGPPKIDWILPGEPAAHADLAEQEPLARDTSRPDAGAGPPLPLPMPTELPGGSIAPEHRAEAMAAVEAADGDALRRLVVELSAELYRRGAYSEVPLRELLLIAATTMVTPDRGLAPDGLPGLSPREREIVRIMQDFFRKLGRELEARGDPEVLVAALDELSRSLHGQPRLILPTAAMCSRVSGFGDYDEFPRTEEGHYRFLAQSGQQAVVYVEVENFTSTPNRQGQWVTELSQQLIVYSDRDGIPVWREDWQLGTDASKNRREDFFVVQIVTLPEQLSVGLYELKIRVRDEQSGAESEAIVEFEMVADSRLTE